MKLISYKNKLRQFVKKSVISQKNIESKYTNDFTWVNNNNNKKIEVTVGLPLFRSQKILWLALESLKNQKLILFGWELIIIEEEGNSLNIIKSFSGKLPGCQRICYKHRSNPDKLPITTKWITISKLSTVTSKIFVFQDADDYSPTKRLHIHYEHFKNKNCLLSTQVKGIFYNIYNKKTVLYNGYLESTKINKTHLNHAILTRDMKRMKDTREYRLMHNFIFRNLRPVGKKFIFTNEEVDISTRDNWKTGFFTDGYNNISSRQKYYYNITKPFQKNPYDLIKYIPVNVVNYLSKIKML